MHKTAEGFWMYNSVPVTSVGSSEGTFLYGNASALCTVWKGSIFAKELTFSFTKHITWKVHFNLHSALRCKYFVKWQSKFKSVTDRGIWNFVSFTQTPKSKSRNILSAKNLPYIFLYADFRQNTFLFCFFSNLYYLFSKKGFFPWHQLNINIKNSFMWTYLYKNTIFIRIFMHLPYKIPIDKRCRHII